VIAHSESVGESVVCLTFDVDWAHEEVVADTVGILERFGAKATFFATHDSPLLRTLDPARYEIGLHPNFHPLLDGTGTGSFRATLDELMSLYPTACGLRSHSLVTSGRILAYARSRGIRYESNMLLPQQVAPFRDYDGLMRVPMFWLDYREMLVAPDFASQDLALAHEVPAVFGFHPIHVFLNTERPERYEASREHFQAPEELRAHRNGSGTPGTRDFLSRLLERIDREGRKAVRMIDLVDAHEAAHGTAAARPPSQPPSRGMR